MRLLNTTSFTLQEFSNNQIPEYVILSHRWEDDEVLFRDLESLATDWRTKKGSAKLMCCATTALRHRFQWAWIDTCCIDKSSSAELSEAINSMFNWYERAAVCYAYLSDVSASTDLNTIIDDDSEFRQSKWFTRGWTLQELLAPSDLVFFNREWIEIGTKRTIVDLISQITGIRHIWGYHTASVAEKMSWASKRETTRIEDRAYSLLGIFGVSMTPLYGEGNNAFHRLQLEILSISDDESIFVWEDEDELTGGLLAQSASAFRYFSVLPHALTPSTYDGGFVPLNDYYRLPNDRPHYFMTNKGFHISCVLMRPVQEDELLRSFSDADDVFATPLNFGSVNRRFNMLSKHIGDDRFIRCSGKLPPFPIFPLGSQIESSQPDYKPIYVRPTVETDRTIHIDASKDLSSIGFHLSGSFISDHNTSDWTTTDEEISLRIVTGPRIETLAGMEFAQKFNPASLQKLARSVAVDRFVVVLQVYGYRPRVVVYTPPKDFLIEEGVASLIECEQQGLIRPREDIVCLLKRRTFGPEIWSYKFKAEILQRYRDT